MVIAPARPAARRAGAVALVVVPALLGIQLVPLGRTDPGTALPLALTLAGSTAVLGGLLLVARAVTSDGLRLTGFRLLLGVAAIVFGAGQLLAAWQSRGVYPGYPTEGDVLSGVAALPAVLGAVVVPRRNHEVGHALRLALEGVMVGSAAGLVLWRVLLLESVHIPGDLATLALLVLEVVVTSVLVVTAVREADRGLGFGALGMTIYTASDAYAISQVLAGHPWPWESALAGALVWPLLVVGLLMVRSRSEETAIPRQPARESRRQVLVATACSVLLAVAVLTFDGGEALDVISKSLLLVFVGALCVRELVRAVQTRKLQERLADIAGQDPLTGLPNRRALAERLDRLASRPRDPFWFLTLDLDGFKDVNDLLGHSTGDRVLQVVATTVRKRVIPAGADAFRLGGDEFAVIVPGTQEEARELADDLVRLIGARLLDEVTATGRVSVSVSIGVDRLRVDGGSTGRQAQASMAASAQAMRQAKLDGRGRVVVFGEPLAARARRRQLVERRLREVVAAEGVDVHFQPIYDVGTGYLVGVEALARWDDPVLGQVNPQEFIEVAEEAGLIGDLGDQILHRALRLMSECGGVARGVRVAVNVSTIQLREPGYVDRVMAALAERGVPPEQLVVEVTESVFVRPDDPAVVAITHLAEQGVPIALDDFGSGYSSLGYLSRLPVKILKADMSLTRHLHEPRTLAIGRTIVQLAVGLGLDVVFEGVSTPQQEALVRGLGAQFVQGWLFAKAMPVTELVTEMDRSCAPKKPVAAPLVPTQATARRRLAG